MRKKNQWRICDIYSGKSKNFNIRAKRSFWHADFYPIGNRRLSFGARFGGLLKGLPCSKPKALLQGGLTVLISVLVIYTVVQAGSLTPSASPASTMKSLQDIWNRLAGSDDTSDVSADGSGDVIERLEFIQQNLGGYTYGSSDPGDVLTTAGGTYNATNLIVSNVRSGVAFGVGLTGTYGGEGWTYGSDDASKVLTIADAAGTYDASNLATSTVKSGVTFGVGLTGAYPSATYPLPGDTAAPDATAADMKTGVEAWTKAGVLITGSGTQTLSAANDTVTAGYYDATTLSAVDPDLAPENILSGVTIFGFTGTVTAAPNWSLQKNVRWDDWRYSAGTTGSPFNEYTGEEATWTQTDAGGDTAKCVTDNGVEVCLYSNEVWQDTRTGLYWSDRTAVTVDNEFRYDDTGQCNFTDTGTANSYCDNQDPTSVYTEDDDVSANDFCLNLQLDADNDGTLETDWRLPSQKELQQAYIDGSANNLPNAASNFWSATESTSGAAYAWGVYLSNGGTNYATKVSNYYARCVRP
jgi:hypothetical protein